LVKWIRSVAMDTAKSAVAPARMRVFSLAYISVTVRMYSGGRKEIPRYSILRQRVIPATSAARSSQPYAAA